MGGGAQDFTPTVYQGLWKAYHKPPLHQWVLTVSTKSSIFILAALAMFIGATQGRAWIIARYLVFRFNKPISLPGGEVAKVETKSEFEAAIEAVKCGIQRVKRKWKKFATDAVDPADSTWYGIAAIGLYILFAGFTTILPFWISDGTYDPPIVRSEETAECLKSDRLRHLFDMQFRMSLADDAYIRCIGPRGMTCDETFFNTDPEPRLTIERTRSCPFPDVNICLQSKGIRITQSNMTLLDAGVNSPYPITLSHRLTCNPLNLDPLTYHPIQQSTRSFISLRAIDESNPSTWWANFSAVLHTLNGPNQLSSDNSGEMAYLGGYKPVLSTLPGLLARKDVENHPEVVHPGMRLEFATPWVAIYQPGYTSYVFNTSDPFFHATNCKLRGNGESVDCIPSREAAGIGCAEEFSFCSDSLPYCTPFLQGIQSSWLLEHLLRERGHEAEAGEAGYLVRMMPGWFSVFDSLGSLTSLFNRVPLTDYSSGLGIIRQAELDGEDMWAKEVERWYRTAMLAGVFYSRLGASFKILRTMDNTEDEAMLKRYGLCGRVLFRHKDYLNIDWVGFWASIGAFGLVWLVSWGVVHRMVLEKHGRKILSILDRNCWLYFLEDSRGRCEERNTQEGAGAGVSNFEAVTVMSSEAPSHEPVPLDMVGTNFEECDVTDVRV
ncbi:hypothetical protein MKZ38_008705 [Zalerion maritima]|uniref:Uncharacterized protein n=1 Tax=Zalerion maritima TaxID=339359 RepID=A0AAD5RGY3_9PEZI|nr:hypothetical protein MKZ38_008705 [Zalerion maritima]